MARPNPSSCCGIANVCCGLRSLPEVLHCSIVGNEFCGCASLTTDLVMVFHDPVNLGTLWSATLPGALCGSTVTIDFMCDAGGNCNFELNLTSPDCGLAIFDLPKTTCECDVDTPLNVVWLGVLIGPCCGGGMPEAVDVTVTE